MRWFVYLLGLGVVLACLGCQHSNTGWSQDAQQRKQQALFWSYQGATGPAHWAELEQKNLLCAHTDDVGVPASPQPITRTGS